MAPRPRKPLKVASKPKVEEGSASGACAVAAGCQVGDLFRLLGKAHMLDILYLLTRQSDGPRRFVDLQHALAISPNTLSERLRELVEAGLLTRTAYNEIPPRVDYQATVKARDLDVVFASLYTWSQKHDLKPLPVEIQEAVQGAA